MGDELCQFCGRPRAALLRNTDGSATICETCLGDCAQTIAETPEDKAALEDFQLDITGSGRRRRKAPSMQWFKCSFCGQAGGKLVPSATHTQVAICDRCVQAKRSN